MLSLLIRTDKPNSELYLFENDQQIAKKIWEAHRKLADTLNIKIDELLKESDKSLTNLDKIVIFKGPGSFTGLRIGFSVANALAYSLDIPIIATGGDDWVKIGLESTGELNKFVTPTYGSEANITKQKK